jgi:hypothetical protein
MIIMSKKKRAVADDKFSDVCFAGPNPLMYLMAATLFVAVQLCPLWHALPEASDAQIDLPWTRSEPFDTASSRGGPTIPV